MEKTDQEIKQEIKERLDKLEEAANDFINIRNEKTLYYSSINKMKILINDIDKLHMQLEQNFLEKMIHPAERIKQRIEGLYREGLTIRLYKR